jgi:DnaK suppressor protein
MDEKFLKTAEQKLEKEKEVLEGELKQFAKQNSKLKGDWSTKFPHFNGGVGSQRLEEAADEVEEYLTLLPIESRLELKLQAVNLALEKINKGEYGKCEKCKKDIPLERLEVYPAASTCLECK